MDDLDHITEKLTSLKLQDDDGNSQGDQSRGTSQKQPASRAKSGFDFTPPTSETQTLSFAAPLDNKRCIGAVTENSTTASSFEETDEDEEHMLERRKKRKMSYEEVPDTEAPVLQGKGASGAPRKRKMEEEVMGELEQQSDKGEWASQHPFKGPENSLKREETKEEQSGEQYTQTGYILDRHARSRDVPEISKFFLQALDAESTDTEPSAKARYQGVVNCVPPEDITRQLWLRVKCHKFTLLHGPPGCGKTTAALVLHSAVKDLTTKKFEWCDSLTFAERFKDSHETDTVYIIDNFFGHTSLDSYDRWRPVYQRLRRTLDENIRVLLITRTSILQQALALTGADFADMLNKNTFVELTLNHRIMFSNMLPEAREKPNFDATPDIGFPVCCRLASSMPTEWRRVIFQRPQSTLRSFLREMMQDPVALLSFGLLAVTEGYVNARDLRDPVRLQDSNYLKVLQAMEAGDIKEERLAQILDFFADNQGLVQVEDDFVSFTNEAVREAVLCVLCESHAYFVSMRCSMRHLSRLAQVTRDPEQTEDDDEKPVLPEAARRHFLLRLLLEMRLRNHRDSLSSALFQHPSFYRDFLTKAKEKSLRKLWERTSDNKGLHFLFWASACKAFNRLTMMDTKKYVGEVIRQGIVGGCYWGNTNMLKGVLNNVMPQLQKPLIKCTMVEFFSQNAEVNCDKTPFYPEDTLLTLAAWRGKDDVVKELVAMGADVNAQGHNGLTALMHYCARGNEAMVEFLLEKGAVYDHHDDLGNTALHYALLGGLKNIHNDLFRWKNLAQKNRDGNTPWFLACYIGAPSEVLGKLRKYAVDMDLHQCLRLACRAGQADVAKYLLEIESKSNVIFELEDLDAADLMMDALGSGNTSEVNDIIRSKLLFRNDNQKLSELCTFYCEGNDDSVLNSLFPVVKNHTDTKMATVLACCVGNRTAFEHLLQVNPTPEDKRFLLETSVCLGSWEFTKWVMTTTETNVTQEAVMLAIKCQHTQIVKEMLPFYKEPRSLHLAAKHDLVPLIRWLLDNHHAEVNALNEEGFTALDFAMALGHDRAFKCLLTYGADLATTARNVSTSYDDLTQNKPLYRAFEKSGLCIAER